MHEQQGRRPISCERRRKAIKRVLLFVLHWAEEILVKTAHGDIL